VEYLGCIGAVRWSENGMTACRCRPGSADVWRLVTDGLEQANRLGATVALLYQCSDLLGEHTKWR
jgi:hypothetical protein